MKIHTIANWVARISGLLVSILFVGFLVGEMTDGLFRHTGPKVLVFAVLLGCSVVGCLLAWFDPFPGGILSFLGGLALATFHYLRGDWVSAMVYGIPFIIVGGLFLMSHKADQRKIKTY